MGFSLGNKNVTLEIIEGKYGHDTFLLDLDGMGGHTMVSNLPLNGFQSPPL